MDPGWGWMGWAIPRLSDRLSPALLPAAQEGRWNDSPCNQTLPSICKKPGRVSQEKEEDDHGCRKVRGPGVGGGSGCSTAQPDAHGFGVAGNRALRRPHEQHPEVGSVPGGC